MTTENVAVLFTDIVGSTELSQLLSPEEADEVRRSHFSILRQATAEAGGTEVKNLGDGIMVVFGSASAAISCAVAMHQSVDRDNRAHEHSVELRVGLSCGEVSREDDDYFGDPVIEAARLCATCKSGQVLAADVVRLTAGRRSRHQCRSLGALTLKGLRDPVQAVEVLWEPLAGSATNVVPLPGRLTVRPTVGVVGRDAELSELMRATKRVIGDGGHELLLVSGEAGVGKTTLVAAAARAAFDDGACVLFGHCEEDLTIPYQLFSEALGHYVTYATEDQLIAHVETYGSELVPLVPVLASRIPDLPPSKATDNDTERYLLFAAVVGLLAMASQDRPIVLVLDDLQWADKGSLQLLLHMAASELPMRVLLFVIYRDSELSLSNPLRETMGALHRHSNLSHVKLAGLDDSGVVSFLESAAGYTLDDAGVGLAHAVYRETDGNPFFVGELLRHLSDTGAIYQDTTGRWVAKDSLDELALPDSVRMVIGGRVARLGEIAERTLSLAAVIGRDFDLDLLARASEASEDELLQVLDAATAVALVRELADTPGRYNFAHALIQHTLYEDLGSTRRARAHRKLAEALEELYGDQPGDRMGDLARHWLCATRVQDSEKAIKYAQLAGDRAIRQLAPDEAGRWYEQALEVLEQLDPSDDRRRAELLTCLGDAQRQSGNAAYRGTLMHAANLARAIGDADALVAAALANTRGFVSSIGQVDVEKIEVLESCLALLPVDHPHRSILLAILCQELTFGSPIERRQSLATEALTIALALGDRTSVVRVLNHVLNSLQVPPLIEQSLTWTAEAMTLAEQLGDPSLLFWAATDHLSFSACAGNLEEVDRCLGVAETIARELGQPTMKWTHAFLAATRSLIAGDPIVCDQLAQEAFRIGTDGGEPDALFIFGAQMLFVAWEDGTMGDLVPTIEQAVRENPAVPSYRAALAAALLEGGFLDGARRMLDSFAESDFALPFDNVWLSGLVGYAEVAFRCRAVAHAGELLERLTPWASLMSYSDATVEGPVSHYLGGLSAVLGRYDHADAHFAHSAEFSNRIGAKFFAARTDLEWGIMLAERRAPGDFEKSRVLFSKALTAAKSNGYRTVESRATEALQGLD